MRLMGWFILDGYTDIPKSGLNKFWHQSLLSWLFLGWWIAHFCCLLYPWFWSYAIHIIIVWHYFYPLSHTPRKILVEVFFSFIVYAINIVTEWKQNKFLQFKGKNPRRARLFSGTGIKLRIFRFACDQHK